MLIRTATALMLALLLLASPLALGQSSVTPEDLAAAKAEIERLKQDLLLKEAQLRVMELQAAQQKSTPIPKPAAKPMPQAKSVEMAKTGSPPPMIAPAARKAMINAAPYEASIQGRVQMFRTDQSAKWLTLDEKRLVYWVLDDEAYLLNLTDICPGLLTANKLKLENFSTKVRAGHDHVVVDNQRCLIGFIEKLGGRSLPKPPRR